LNNHIRICVKLIYIVFEGIRKPSSEFQVANIRIYARITISKCDQLKPTFLLNQHATHQRLKRTKTAANILKKIYRYQIRKKILHANHKTFTPTPPKSVYFKKQSHVRSGRKKNQQRHFCNQQKRQQQLKQNQTNNKQIKTENSKIMSNLSIQNRISSHLKIRNKLGTLK
jgi:G3E family GTPase